MIRVLAALDRKRGIAKHGYQPWYIADDEAYFAKLSKAYGGNVLVGGITFRNALKSKPLAGRTTYLLTKNQQSINGVHLVHDLDAWLGTANNQDIWVIGGASVYEQIMAKNLADELYLTHIDADFNCDQFFPDYESKFHVHSHSEPKEQNGFRYIFSVYTKAKT
jgi:dihydrofolate reductase